ncbi:hypothetical protein [Paenibacillus sp. HW567]|uniref:hypothetical protein n=1 Tax=Paenibacillus sp. HW567 TaxID=1034769 RepID=UPI000362FABA|nr:hypothetical protein [Paenibacillus sp. HW567]
MKKVIGWVSLLLGAWITIAGVLGTKSDQYKEEAYFNGMYGNETHSTVIMAIVAGIVLLVIGVVLIMKKADASSNHSARVNTSQSEDDARFDELFSSVKENFSDGQK